LETLACWATAQHRQQGRRALYADAEDPGLWSNIHLGGVHTILLAMPEAYAKVMSIKELRNIGFTGTITTTAIFEEEVAALEAAGADYVFDETEIEALANEPPRARSLANEVNFFIAETAYMPMIGKSLGRVLGPRGKMPEPLTSDKDIAQLINRARNSIKVRSKDRATFHESIGQRNMQPETLVENVESVIMRLEQKLERGAQNIRSVYIKTTMGPAVRVR